LSITETNQIDGVAARDGSSIVKLVIMDHLSWDDFDTHARLLQEKINAYLEYVHSGRLSRLSAPKIPESPEIRITLALTHAPPGRAIRFLAQVTRFLAESSIKFDVEHR
jgi:hypothetical protein